MKKKLFAIMFLTALVLCACGSDGNKNRIKNGTKSVNDVLQEQNQKTSKDNKDSRPADSDQEDESATDDTASKSTPDELVPAGNVPPTEEPEEYGKIDVDLTKMSATMVYTEVYNMQSEPDNYEGKIVKMKGTSGYFLDEDTNVYYFACVIQDATACCANGIEYELNKNYKIPLDYPEMDDEITVVGRFETYLEGDYKYIRLKNANLLEDKG